MILCNLLKFYFIWNFHDKEKCLTSFGALKYCCVLKTIEMFHFMPVINNSVTIGLNFLLLI